MPYASQTDIINRSGLDELLLVADPTNSGTPDATKVATALGDATEEINSFVQAKYPLESLAPSQPLLVIYCVDIAMYRMARPGLALTDEKRIRFDDAQKGLAQIAHGTRRLAVIPTPKSSSGSATLVSGKRRMSRKSLRGIL